MLGFGALMALRRPRNLVGWLMLVSSSMFMLELPVNSYIIHAIYVRNRALPGADLLGTVFQMAWVPAIVITAIFLPLVFPTGRLLSRRWRPLVWVAVAASSATILGGAFNSHPDPTLMVAGVRPIIAPPPLRPIANVLIAAIILLPASVIAAAVPLGLRYRRCLEALQNIAKYDKAKVATATLRATPGFLWFDVRDNGAGFDPDPLQRCSGLQNMADRLDALGGMLEVTSAPGDGTTLRGRLPVSSSEALLPEAVA